MEPDSVQVMVRSVVVETYEIPLQEDETPFEAAQRVTLLAARTGWNQFREIASDVDSEKIYVSTNDGQNWNRVEVTL